MDKPTTFILAGGNDRTTEGYGECIAAELTKHVSRPKILSCFFSLPENEWPAKFQQWKEWFKVSLGSNFTYDFAKKQTFLRQVDEADVIYLHGGDTKSLFNALPEVSQLKEHFKGKVIVGSSAGANVLSKNYWSSTRSVPVGGLDIVDVNVMVHFGALSHEERLRTPEDWPKEEAEFQRFIGAGEAITHLPEGQLIVKQVNL